MNLFVINRYTGEENNSAHAESDKLKKVLKNIEKRKKQRKQRKLATAVKEVIKENNVETLNEEEINASTAENELINEDTAIPSVPENVDKHEKKLENIEGFTVLNSEQYNKKQIVKRVLPRWLRNPSVVSTNLQKLDKKVSKVSEFDKDLKNKLKERGVKYLFPVQAEFIPWQMNTSKFAKCIIPQDVCLSAPTGSGKTLAFLLPVFECLKQKLLSRRTTWKTVRALLVLPTQSLAIQTYNTFKSFCMGTELDVGIVTGEHSFHDEQKQVIAKNSVWGFVSRVDILVCTAGRLVNHLKSTEGFDLSHLEYLVIDEADRVLDTIQDNWLHHLNIHLRANDFNSQILNLLSVNNKSSPQKLLFSATLSQDPEKLQKLMLFQPKLFTCIPEDTDITDPEPDRFVGKYTTPTELSEKYVTCTAEVKPLVLYKLISDMIAETDKLPRILIFTVSADMAHRLKLVLETMSQQKIRVGEISSNRLSLERRNTLLNSFVNGDIHVLVCTDSMARGIDLPNVNCVISYSAPSYLKTYIHRAGRTARAGAQGLSISILQPNQKEKFLTMLSHAGKQNLEAINVTEENVEPLIPLYKESLEKLKQHITSETENSLTKMKRGKKTGILKSHRKKKVHVSKE